jgi:hypothetical protein
MGYFINMLLLQVKDYLRIVELVKFFFFNIFCRMNVTHTQDFSILSIQKF